ncbi:MAG: hypothetical protein ACXVXE_08880 [Nocardioidaceae bacterium]
MTSVPLPSLRPTLRSSAYVAAVAVPAAAGFTTGSTWPILLAAGLALPASLLALPGYYLAYGLLALVPGANPSAGTGSGRSLPGGGTVTTVTGTPAAWFTTTTHLLGILALAAAAVVNVLLLRHLAARAGQTAPSP